MTHPSDPRPRAALVAASALLAALAAGCNIEGGSNGGDKPMKPVANEYGVGQPISSTLCHPDPGMFTCSKPTDCGTTEICQIPSGQSTGLCSICGFMGPAPWFNATDQNSTGCNYPPAAEYPPIVHVDIPGIVVTAVDTYDETGDGATGSVYVQDVVPAGTPTPVYGATSIFGASYSPPDLRPQPADVIDLNGLYEEFIGPSVGYFSQCATLPQLSGAASYRFTGTVPEPVVITPDDLNSYANARRYVNMLVKVQNVVLSNTAPSVSSGRYCALVNVDSGSQFCIANELFDLPTQKPLSQGQSFKSVTGIVTYFYNYQLAPRSPADFEM